MPAEVKWAPCVTGLSLWHEADEHGGEAPVNSATN